MRGLNAAALAVLTATGAGAVIVPGRLTVVVFDYAGAPPKLLASAAREGQRALRTAGVETDWILCSPMQSCYVPERFVKVRIIPRRIANQHTSLDSLGTTTACPNTDQCDASNVFYDSILRFTTAESLPVDVTLGYVIVHEIGHQMGLSHSSRGIMIAAFTPQDLHNAAAGWLNFGEDDARELRAAVARSQGANAPGRRSWISTRSASPE